MEYVQLMAGGRAVDKDGSTIPGGASAGSATWLNQVYYLSGVKLLGGLLGFDLTVPVSGPSATGSLGGLTLSANRAGLGDLVVGPALQWNGHSLLGKPFFHRVEVDVFLPFEFGVRNRFKGSRTTLELIHKF